MNQLSEADLVYRLKMAAEQREQLAAWRARPAMQRRVARLLALSARIQELNARRPEPFRREEWGGMPNYVCRFCWFAVVNIDVAWIHYQKQHPGQVYDG